VPVVASQQIWRAPLTRPAFWRPRPSAGCPYRCLRLDDGHIGEAQRCDARTQIGVSAIAGVHRMVAASADAAGTLQQLAQAGRDAKRQEAVSPISPIRSASATRSARSFNSTTPAGAARKTWLYPKASGSFSSPPIAPNCSAPSIFGRSSANRSPTYISRPSKTSIRSSASAALMGQQDMISASALFHWWPRPHHMQ